MEFHTIFLMPLNHLNLGDYISVKRIAMFLIFTNA